MTDESRKLDQSPLIALALIVALVAAGAWFLRPICVAGICPEETATPKVTAPNTAKVAEVAPREPLRPATRPVSASSTPALPLPALQWETDPAAAEPAGRELEADASVDAAWAIADPGDEVLAQTGEGDLPAANRTAEVAERAALQAESLAALAETALWDPDEGRRGEAIHAVGLQRNSGEALAVLSEVATLDWDPDNRYAAVRSLWSAAADGADGDGAIRELLEATLGDDNESVAQLARQALDDLAALEANRIVAD